ncbi:TetR/AcrR family transcriptional regulator [Mesorhizobium calcicola]|uniref:TetR/AcrR family transcriptional regulator n=1 Tax=Mesorhizobium calcicola TaxID=1300310 RepID=A0ABW4WGQ4_9HYPH
MEDDGNRKALIRAASALLRQRGYAGVGMSDILAATGLSKGSLYYHFPGGKQQLALEATQWAECAVGRVIEHSFVEAADFVEGAKALCRAIVGLATEQGRFTGCPVLSIIQAGDEAPNLRIAGASILAGWTGQIAAHARRFGYCSPEEAADLLVMQVEGAWVLAMARQDATPFKTLERCLANTS